MGAVSAPTLPGRRGREEEKRRPFEAPGKQSRRTPNYVPSFQEAK